MNQWKGSINKIIICFITFLLTLSFCSISKVQAQENGSITISKWPIADTEFLLYRVAGLNGTEILPENEYESFIKGKDLYSLKQGEWEDLANKMSEYIQKNQIQPTQTLTYRLNGENAFTNLPTGLYLVKENTVSQAKKTYTSQNSLIRVPDAEINYDVKAELKVSSISFSENAPHTVNAKTKNNGSRLKTGTGNAVKKHIGNVKTGDPFKGELYEGIIATDAGIIVFLLIFRNRQKKRGGQEP